MSYPLSSKYKKTVIFVILFLAALQIVVNFSESDPTRRKANVVHRIINAITFPIERGIYLLQLKTHTTVSDYVWLVNVKEENESLKKTIAGLQRRLDELREFEVENQRLRTLLDFKQAQALAAIPATIISKDLSPEFKTIGIDKGEKDGVRTGMAVISPLGVVGKILEAYAHNSAVILVNDPNSTIDVIIQRLRAKAIATGDSWDMMRFKYIEKRFELEKGDTVITSGLAGIYPKGLTVGTIAEIKSDPNQLFQDVTLKPSVDFDTLEEVLVLTGPL